jgi:hypothetical protein
VSRQRVGLELNKMLSLDTEKALDALEQIAALDLHDVVFPVPPYLPQQTGHEDQGPQGFRQRVLQDATGAQVAVGSWSKDLKQTALQCLRENFRYAHARLGRVSGERKRKPAILPYLYPAVPLRLLKDAPSGTELVQALPTLSESMPVGNGLALVSSFLLPALIGASSAGRARCASDKATELDGDGLITDNYYEDELTHNSYNRIRDNAEAVFKHALSVRSSLISCSVFTHATHSTYFSSYTHSSRTNTSSALPTCLSRRSACFRSLSSWKPSGSQLAVLGRPSHYLTSCTTTESSWVIGYAT